nr:oplophorus-luciferin 2-monooxygenase non-catalytic subunit-like [Cherax quadricarinatus]
MLGDMVECPINSFSDQPYLIMSRMTKLHHTLLVVCTVGCMAVCPPSEDLGPCQCHEDSNGIPALQCQDVTGWEEMESIFTDLGLTYVSSVDIISSPGLTDLPPLAFADVKIDAIRFYNTGLIYLNKEVFSVVTASGLQSLYIKYNSDFTTLENDVLAFLPVLETFYCSHNQLGSLSGVLESTSVPYMDLGHNEISSISANYFSGAQNLSQLLMPFNKLTTESLGPESLTFSGNEEDMYLDLAWNQLSEGVHPSAFGGRMAKELILSHNNITTLNQDTFAAILDQMFLEYGSDAYILLDSNELGCDCDMSWVVSHTARGLLQQAECTDGRLVSGLTVQDFQNC